MSNIRTHKELQVWQDAMTAATDIYHLTKTFPADERYALVDRIRRSSRSVAANISEAWRKRRYEAAFISKLNDSEAEASETQTWLEVALRCSYSDKPMAGRPGPEIRAHPGASGDNDTRLAKLDSSILNRFGWI